MGYISVEEIIEVVVEGMKDLKKGMQLWMETFEEEVGNSNSGNMDQLDRDSNNKNSRRLDRENSNSNGSDREGSDVGNLDNAVEQ